MFEQTSILGLSPDTVLYLSILWSFHSSNSLHLKSIEVEKGSLQSLFPFEYSQCFIYIFSIVRLPSNEFQYDDLPVGPVLYHDQSPLHHYLLYPWIWIVRSAVSLES